MNHFLLHQNIPLVKQWRKVSFSPRFITAGFLFLLVFLAGCTDQGKPQGEGAGVVKEAKFAEGAIENTKTEPTNVAQGSNEVESPQDVLAGTPAQTKKDSWTRDELLGRFDQRTHPEFVAIGKPYSTETGMYLRGAAAEAFKKMWEAAKKDGVQLNIISSTRNFERQSQIWNAKWAKLAGKGMTEQEKAKNILLFSSMPGSSRHHWGTDIDLNNLNDAYFLGNKPGAKVYAWLVKNAAQYGFCQPYTSKKDGRTGYEEEKWHWSYMPLAQPILAAYLSSISYDDITGFEGAHVAKEVDIIRNYVRGIGCGDNEK